MRYLFLFSFFSLVFIASAQSEAEQLLSEMVTSKGTVGIIAGYSIDGKTIWQNDAGEACQDSKSVFLPDTKTRIASIAKPMTAVAVMQLVEQGKLDLDTSIRSIIDDFPEKKKGDITLRQLLAHTSGIPQYLDEKEVENQTQFDYLSKAMDVFDERALLFEPGSDFFYTSYGYVVIGRVIEEASGMSFEDYMQQNIWDKAGMTNTGVEHFNKTYEGKACLYYKKKKKAKLAVQNNLSNRTPGGGFYSTLNDMLKFGNAIVENKLIKAETYAMMTESQFTQKEGNQYGLGWFFYGPTGHENIVVGHSGEQTGCASQLMIIPKSKTVVVVLSNTSGTWKDVVTLSSELIRISEE